MATLKEARQLLATQIDAAVTDVDVDVIPFDPPDATPPIITVSTGGITATEWQFIVRLYMDAGQSEQAQDALDDLAETVVLNLDDAIPRASWSWEFDDLKGLFVMVTTVESPREDF